LSNRFIISSSDIFCRTTGLFRLILTAWLIITVGLFISCGGGKSDSPQDDFNADFRFLVISDTHVRLPGNADSIDYNAQRNLDNLAHIINRINTDFSTADFVAVTGDMVGCLFSENPDDYGIGMDTTAERYKSMIDTLSMPVYSTLGNHDYQKSYDPVLHEGVSSQNRDAIEAVWKKVLGMEPYYSIVNKGVRMVFANSNRGDAYNDVCPTCTVEMGCTGSFDAGQIAWLRAELANPEPAIIFIHHPPVTDNQLIIYFALPSFLIENGDEFYNVVEDNQDKILAIFVGHGHVWAYDTLGSVRVYETGATGDGSSSGNNINIVEVSTARRKIKVTNVKQ
jgi:3',5'-cyclic AMP phosphodiesterase CpdA